MRILVIEDEPQLAGRIACALLRREPLIPLNARHALVLLFALLVSPGLLQAQAVIEGRVPLPKGERRR